MITFGSRQEISPSGVAFVVEERPNSSSEFFVLPAIAGCGYRAVHCGFSDLPSVAELDGAVIVFVRYVTPAWAKLVDEVRPRLSALVFFMDDDVLDRGASVGMPLQYRFKLERLAFGRAGWLRRHAAEMWVSTPYLQKKYENWHPKLVLPSPVTAPTDMRRVFYHGSVATHDAEIRWLRPVMEEALRRDERLVLEIVGGHDVYQLYRGLPRVNVVHTMKWAAYKQFLVMPGRHIGLAPLLGKPFNRARAYTKFFDITRCGAVGIYSPGNVYSEAVSHGVDGLLVEPDPAAWVEAILSLAQDEARRQELLRNAEAKSIRLAELAQRGYSGLLSQQHEGTEPCPGGSAAGEAE
jgi:hypothetical protein